MSVFFRTGENTAASVPWWVYLCFILPVQLLWLFAKALVYVFAAMAAAVVFVSVRTYHWWNDRKPPHPEG